MLDIPFGTVPEFMRALLVTESHFPAARVWYFRGQSDASWGLVPSLFRRDAWKPFGGVDALGLQCNGQHVVSPQNTLKFQEDSMLKMVANIIDRIGLPPHLKQDPEREAFARHIGLPTRLLDWSRSPWTAAYFAAAGAAEKFREPGRLAVFAISTFFIGQSTKMKPFEELQVAGAGNPNLVAQRGVLIRVPDDRIDLLEGHTASPLTLPLAPGDESRLDRELVRITLPWSESLKLMRTLREQDVHGAAIYPGQEGVAQLVRELFITDANPDF